MKRINLLIILLCSLFEVKAQSISPSENNEYCPGVEITFTVTIPGTLLSIIGESGGIVTTSAYNINSSGGNTTFNLKGKFTDANQMQTFAIANTSGNSYRPLFKKIKSLFYDACNYIQPNQASITAPPCETSNFTVSFNNLQWKTQFESPTLCFGSITTYEYLLPMGWRLNSTLSDGSTWIQLSSNNVSVTSDASHGGSIQIRPVNSCNASLTKGTPVSIPIYRNKPTLSFTGGYGVCTSQDFQASGVPSWVSNYNWVVTPNTVFGNANPTSNPTTVTNLANGEGNIQLTISSSTCPLSFLYNTQEITGRPKLVAGAPQVLGISAPLAIYSGPGSENEVCRYQGNEFDFTYTSSTSVNWSAISHQGGSWPSWSEANEGDLYVEFFTGAQNTLVLKMDATNTCGTTSYQFGFKGIDCDGFRSTQSNQYKISPNPSANQVNIVSVGKAKNQAITEVIIADFNNNIMSRKKYDKAQRAQIFIGGFKPGTYYVTIVCGKEYRETQKILKR